MSDKAADTGSNVTALPQFMKENDATVELEDEDGKVNVYQIVGDDEADIKENRISISSPVARSLIGKYEGDEVTCPAPKGLIHYAIVSVKYI